MEQRKSTTQGHSGTPSVTTTPPAWMRRTAPYSPDRRAKMLEHLARARSLPQPQPESAPAAPGLPGPSAKDILGDVIGYAVVFAILALLFQSRIPLYLGAFVVLTDAGRIESALATIGIRFEPETIGPEIVKRSAFWFGWFALLPVLTGSVPAWLAPWMPPAKSWPFIAGIALLLAVAEALAALAMRRALLPLGLKISPNGLTWMAIQLVLAVGTLALLVLFGFL
ncbi:hypothetical protein [Bradyrhizobium sp. MOS003]|jgi:hypothetical protein|uniref:hypothetical protein n=1 Tax=Bradyrhizobium sp. MOS003 TaxID=2133946 RepID=UPI000D12E320|nr:hypothetical protein [Bradyrhizobium sp. MOS003]PSO17210.1 hypothetical protein C7G42_20795 [Bradyrhizobium sp. MOS003]